MLADARMLADTRVNGITGQVIGAAIEVHRVLDPGLLESTYMTCMQFEMAARKLRFVAQRAVPILYKGIELDAQYRIDLLVEDLVVVEVKTVEHPLPVHSGSGADVHASNGISCGVLINFNVPKLIDGVTRLMNQPRAGIECHAGDAGPVGPAHG